MRQKVFTATFWIFVVTGTFLAITLVGAAINEVLLAVFTTRITFNSSVAETFLTVFKVIGVICLLSFPVVFSNILVRGLQDNEGKRVGTIVAVIFGALLFMAPAILLLTEGKYEKALTYIGIWVIALIIASPGERLVIPKTFQ